MAGTDYLDRFRLDDRVAVVTGGSQGIGRAIALGLTQAGAHAVPVARSRERIEQTVEEIEAAGGESLVCPCDVTEEDAVDDTFEQVLDTFGRLDVLVNCAGINPPGGMGRPEAVEPEDFRRPLDVNLYGAYVCSQAASSALHAANPGAIVNIASISGLVGTPRQHPYTASKHGLVGLTRSLALDWAPDVRVNALAPGYVRTELTQSLREIDELRESVLDRTPMGRFADPEDVAAPAVFLASDAAAYVTGAVIAVDGGWTAQ